MNIVVGASRPRKFKIGAAAIMWWENTPCSHVYVKINMTDKICFVFQAIGSGTQFCNLETFLEHNIPVYEKKIEISKEKFESVMLKAINLLGMRYSIFHLACLFYKRFIQYVFNKIIKTPFNNDGHTEVCIQALTKLTDAAEIKRDSEDPNDMGMFEAFRMLKLMPGEVIL